MLVSGGGGGGVGMGMLTVAQGTPGTPRAAAMTTAGRWTQMGPAVAAGSGAARCREAARVVGRCSLPPA